MISFLLSAAAAALVAASIAHLLDWRAPARKNRPWKALLGFFMPALLIVWAASAWITPSGPTRWGALWLPVGMLGLGAGLLLATVVTPPPPSVGEERRVARRGDVLDPLFLLYSVGTGLALATALVTRLAW